MTTQTLFHYQLRRDNWPLPVPPTGRKALAVKAHAHRHRSGGHAARIRIRSAPNMVFKHCRGSFSNRTLAKAGVAGEGERMGCRTRIRDLAKGCLRSSMNGNGPGNTWKIGQIQQRRYRGQGSRVERDHSLRIPSRLEDSDKRKTPDRQTPVPYRLSRLCKSLALQTHLTALRNLWHSRFDKRTVQCNDPPRQYTSGAYTTGSSGLR